jgi:thiol-disulfide isomerase/thioredoxin
MTSTMRNFRDFGLAVLFAAAFFTWAIITLRPLLRVPATSAAGSSRALAWELKDLDGRVVKSSDFHGKVIILNFWATWCPPCKEEIPGFIELQKKYSDKGLAVIGVSLDEQGPPLVKQFTTKFGVNYPVVIGNWKLLHDFGGTALPTTILIDRSSNVVGKHVGFASQETFERKIVPLL